jgi:DNA-binding protein H-NS
MRTSQPVRLPARLQTLAAMAALLERLENRRTSASADQYRRVAQQINTLLEAAGPGDDLDMLLALAPATAALYENQQYAHAGLCRAPLEAALNAELAATAAIDKARRGV